MWEIITRLSYEEWVLLGIGVLLVGMGWSTMNRY